MKFLIEQHYHVNNARQLNDLNNFDQRQLAIAFLADYHPETAAICSILDQYLYGMKTAETVLNSLFQAILTGKEDLINQLFQKEISRSAP